MKWIKAKIGEYWSAPGGWSISTRYEWQGNVRSGGCYVLHRDRLEVGTFATLQEAKDAAEATPREFRVAWEIEILATSHDEAVRQVVREYLQPRDPERWSYDVTDLEAGEELTLHGEGLELVKKV